MEHPRYAIITNIWGKKPEPYHKFVWDVEKSRNYPDYIEKEIHYFDTLNELKEFIFLFEEYCSSLKLPSCIKNNLNKRWRGLQKWEEGERLWGYLWGDRETRKLTWGGYKLKDYNPGSDKRLLLDKLFRTTDDVPNGYKWDDGEYEGWLQFKWGDGKNAVGYVDEKKVKPKKICDVSDEYAPEECTKVFDNYIDDYEEVENSFLKDEDKEKLRLLANKW